MKIVLLKDLEKLGRRGDIVKVKDGYARNYLIPKGYALRATNSNVKHLNDIEKQKKDSEAKKKEIAENLKVKIEKVKIKLPLKIGETGKSFGRITSLDISEALKEKRIKVDHHIIDLEEGINEIGTYEINIKLHPEIIATLKLKVVEAND